MAPISEAAVVEAGGRIDTIQWVVGEFFPFFLSWESSEVTYYDTELRLEADCTWHGLNHVRLVRYFLTPDARESVYFSIRCKTSDGVKDVALEQTIPEDDIWWDLDIDPPLKIPFMSRITLLCSLWKVDSSRPPGPLSLCEPRVPEVDRPLLIPNPEGDERSASPTGEVKEVHSDGRTATFQWRILDLFQPHKRDCFWWSPAVTYFSLTLWLGMRSTRNGVDCVCLARDLSSAGFEECVHFSIRCQTSDGEEERALVRDQAIPEDYVVWELHIDPPWRIPPSAGATLTCLLWKDNSTGVSRGTQTEVALGQNDEPPVEGVSRETQTENGDSRSDERHSEDMEKLRQKFRLWLQQPQEGDCIRILRPEHFQGCIPEEIFLHTLENEGNGTETFREALPKGTPLKVS